ncbi:MAG: DUF1549 domain-containing protein, partial [Planctomycetia bacterium]
MKSMLYFGRIAAAFTATAALAAEPDKALDFQRDVLPILAEKCFQCHGPDPMTREAGLRLDVRAGATDKLESGAVAVVAGKPKESELWSRIRSTDAEHVMPPPRFGDRLTATQVAVLERWIDAGAPYAGHWAFTPPVKPTVPAGNDVGHPIDRLVAARLKRENLTPAPPAVAEILCRRLHLDVVGLTPTPAAVDAFVAAAAVDRPKAVADLVDRLMKTPQYGERWARVWLDAARYADSNGYEKDLPREQWAWRDWVIDAFNRDLPYDQFVVEQVAGDLTAPAETPTADVMAARQRGLTAAGFLRNGMVNEEGAIVPEEFRMEGMFDRLDCLGKAVLGLSVQCAQCHTHKFDPVEHTEYFGLFAFLNNTHEAQSWVYTPEQLAKIAEIKNSAAAVDERVRKATPDWKKRFDSWVDEEKKRRGATVWEPLEARDLHSSSELNHPTALPDKSILTMGHKTVFGDVTLQAEPDLKNVVGLRLEILTHGDLPFDGPGRSFKGTWALTELVLETRLPGGDKWEKLKLVEAAADFAESDHLMEPEWKNVSRDKDGKRRCGPVAFMIDGNDETAWRADRGPGRRNAESVATAKFEKPLDLPPGTTLKVSVRTNHGGDDNGPSNVMIGRFRVSLTKSPTVAPPVVDHAAATAMDVAEADRT